MRTILLPLLLLGCGDSGSYARAVVIGSLDDTIGGPKGLAQPGDILLENDRIRLAILGARPSMGPHTSGGTILDADLQRSDPSLLHGQGLDQLAEVFPTVNLNTAYIAQDGGEVVVLNDGSDGNAAVVCVGGTAEPFLSLLGGLWLLVGAPDFFIRTDYILEPGAPALKIRTYAVFSGDPAAASCDAELSATAAATSMTDLAILDLALETGVAFGDFYLQGGSTDVFTPNVGFDERSFVNDISALGTNTFQEPIPVDFVAGTADGVSYALMVEGGKLFVPMFTSSQTIAFGAGIVGDKALSGRFPDGAVYSYDRWFALGKGDVGSVLDALLEVTGATTGRIDGFVVEEGTGVALSDAHVFVYKVGETVPIQGGTAGPFSEWQTDVGEDPRADGSFGGTLEPGDYELLVHQEGRPDGERIPVTVTANGQVNLVLEARRPGQVSLHIVDETGLQVPAKVTIYTVDGDSPRDSVLGDSYVAGDPAAVVFAAQGEGSVILPPGTYRAVASRGLEYELGESDTFTVRKDGTTSLELQVIRSVDTSGWVAADFHVHSSPSHDSGVSYVDRIATMVCEGVEFFAATDHDIVSDFDPVIEALGMEDWISSTPGLEVTTLEVGHFLGFPMRIDRSADASGALDWTGLEPGDLVDGLRDLALPGIEPVVFVGHPRDGILGYFDEYGFDPYSGTPGLTPGSGGQLTIDPGFLAVVNPLLAADAFTTDFDAIELLNGKRWDFLRTPTQAELDAFAADPDAVSAYDIAERTLDEQQDLSDGTYTLGYGRHGQIDDWFSLLNLGFRYTALGNSDTHDKTGTESGCPRNYVVSATDDPAFISDVDIATAVREGRVVATYGPFVRFSIDGDDNGPGTTVTGSGTHSVSIEVQSPTWFDVERVELYENGTLIEEWEIEVPNTDILNLGTSVDVAPTEDAWYVVIAMGSGSLAPAFTPVDIPPIELQDVVTDALSGVSAVSSLLTAAAPIPQTHPVHPFALTNPIWVDIDGDGFDAPGLPDWLVAPTAPEEPKKQR
jgi:hypothetical protein